MARKKVFGIDMTIVGTLYVRAKNKTEAMEMARRLKSTMLECVSTGNSETEISELPYDSPRLPELSFSPAMTVAGPIENAQARLAGDC